MDDFVLDLDADRERRAAEREGKNAGLPIRVGGKIIATLPPEFPLDVIEPLRQVDQDLALLLRQAILMGQSQGDDAMNTTGLAIDMLASNPKLPTTFLNVVREAGTRLFGEEGMDALIAYRPTAGDIAALVKGVTAYYGFSLGESSDSSTSPEVDGETSNAISSGTTESTPEASTKRRAKKAS